MVIEHIRARTSRLGTVQSSLEWTHKFLVEEHDTHDPSVEIFVTDRDQVDWVHGRLCLTEFEKSLRKVYGTESFPTTYTEDDSVRRDFFKVGADVEVRCLDPDEEAFHMPLKLPDHATAVLGDIERIFGLRESRSISSLLITVIGEGLTVIASASPDKILRSISSGK